MIRQAISCDICGAEKKQTNHWFVVFETAGELRVSGWSSRNRLRAGSKHLCGQTCLHKLLDEFMARSIAGRVAAPAAAEQPVTVPAHAHPASAQMEPVPARAEADASLIPAAGSSDLESSASLLTALAPPAPPPPAPPPPALLAARPAIVFMPARSGSESSLPAAIPILPDDPPAYSSRRWRAEAWERERNREMHALERHPDFLRRHK